MILITGITGHSGRWFFSRLVRENYREPIRCVVRESSDRTLFLQCPLHMETVAGDLGDVDFLKKAMTGVDTVIHIAGIKWSEKLAKAAIDAGVRWLILVHTTGRFSKYKSASAEYSRIEDGILAQRARIAVTVLRPTMIYGSFRDQNMYKLIIYLDRHRFFPLFGKGDNLMQPIHARDLGNSYYDVLTHEDATINREYDLSGKEPIRYINLIRTVSRALSKRNIYIHIPIHLSIAAAKVYNRVFGKKALVSVEQVMRMNEDKAFSHEPAARDFGYSPVGFQDGIAEEAEEYLAARAAKRKIG